MGHFWVLMLQCILKEGGKHYHITIIYSIAYLIDQKEFIQYNKGHLMIEKKPDMQR